MSDRFSISDHQLSTAGSFMVAAAHAALDGADHRPGGSFESVSGISVAVCAFERGMQTAVRALSDAGHTTVRQISGLMQESSALDAQLASVLGGGFAVTGAAR